MGIGRGLGAAVTGYATTSRQLAQDEIARQQHEQQMQERELQMNKMREEAANRAGLREAAAPTDVQASFAKPDAMDNRDVGLPENAGLPNQGLDATGFKAAGQTFSDKPSADQAAATYNSPEATAARVSAKVMGTDPTAAVGLRGAIQSQNQSATKFSQDQIERARTMKQEGLIDAADAIRRGDAKGAFEAFNKGGQYKLVDLPKLTPVDREIPGVGRQTTYDVEMNVQKPDGSVEPVKINSHELAMSTMPYKEALETTRRGTQTDYQHESRMAALDVRNQMLQLREQSVMQAGANAADRVDVARQRLALDREMADFKKGKADKAGPDVLSKEERLAATAQLTDSRKRIESKEKSIAALTKDPLFAIKANKPGTPEAQTLANAKAELAQMEQQHGQFSDALAKSTHKALKADTAPAEAPAAPAPAGAAPAAPGATAAPAPAKGAAPAPGAPGLSAAAKPAGKPTAIATKADYEKLPKGTTYIHPDGTTRVKK